MLYISFLFFSLSQGIELSSGSIDGYFSLMEISAILTNYSRVYPNLELFSLGTTLDDQEIPCLKLVNPQRPRMLVIGGHHAKELISTTQVLYILDHILTSQMLKKEIWFVPILNVDGLAKISEEYSKTGKIVEIRKNLHKSDCKLEYMGVDLNRNYGFQWGYDNIGSSPKPCDEDYRGEFAFSEKETQAIKNLTEKYKFDSVVSYHSYGNMYIRPTGYTDSSFESLPVAYQKVYGELKNILPKSFRFGTVQEILNYSANGSFMDYLYSIGVFPIEVEIGPESINSFHPDIVKLQSILAPHVEPFELIYNRTASYLMINVENFGRKLMIQVSNAGLATEYTKDVTVEVVGKNFDYKMITSHASKMLDGVLYVTIPNIPSGGDDFIEVMIYCDIQDANVSINFWPPGEREQNYNGELKLIVTERKYIAKVIIGVILIVTLLVLICGAYLIYKIKNSDDLEFVEMVDIMPSVAV